MSLYMTNTREMCLCVFAVDESCFTKHYKACILYYYPYRAFDGQNKIVYSRFVTRRAIISFNIARTLCDQSFNIDLRLRYVVSIHSTENRAMPRPP